MRGRPRPSRGPHVEELALQLHACLDVREVQASFMRFCDRLAPARARGIDERRRRRHDAPEAGLARAAPRPALSAGRVLSRAASERTR